MLTQEPNERSLGIGEYALSVLRRSVWKGLPVERERDSPKMWTMGREIQYTEEVGEDFLDRSACTKWRVKS